MNIKLSQLPVDSNLTGNELIPILNNGSNYITPVYAIYNFLSGDQLIQVTTSYIANSAYILESAGLANDVYSNVNANSGNYVLQTSTEVAYWTNASNQVVQNETNWNAATTYTQNNSAKTFVQSNPTLVPTSSAINNIVAITLDNYNNLTTIDPNTFYVIAT
jgi:hypothetical protein